MWKDRMPLHTLHYAIGMEVKKNRTRKNGFCLIIFSYPRIAEQTKNTIRKIERIRVL